MTEIITENVEMTKVNFKNASLICYNKNKQYYLSISK